MSEEKLNDSIKLLKLAYSSYKKTPEDKLAGAALAKAFEISFEYLWKHFKQLGTAEGYEIYSPRDAIKAALSMKIIQNAEQWGEYLSHRNLSVHDYIGVDSKETPLIVKNFLRDLDQLKIAN
ncbi:MAG TPA: nucleotidyltransferase substrate binding protein [Oligoflexia bacterium]|nr:nucleotidyltransferase substrate binding protein [Oligoflexia bacterium]HMP49900.1 nucleotidyltransferase substrate binding protein [Oligoflexia bacterium]